MAIGIFYSGGFSAEWPEHIACSGVASSASAHNRLACLFAGLIFLGVCRARAMAGICIGPLVGYWALLNFVPIRQHSVGNHGPCQARLPSRATPRRPRCSKDGREPILGGKQPGVVRRGEECLVKPRSA